MPRSARSATGLGKVAVVVYALAGLIFVVSAVMHESVQTLDYESIQILGLAAGAWGFAALAAWVRP